MTFAVLIAGQSNAAGQVDATDGDHTIEDNVYGWNSPMMGAGTAWQHAAYGLQPFNRGVAPYANNIGLSFANELARRTGDKVYLTAKAKDSKEIECFIKPATLTANGWTASEDLSVNLYPDLANSIAAIPGRTEATLDYILWSQGNANSADSAAVYAAKLTALIADLTTAGLFNVNKTRLVCIALTSPTAYRDTHKAGILAASQLYVHSDGAEYQDGNTLHYTGAGLMRMGRRAFTTAWKFGCGKFRGKGSPEYQFSASVGATYHRSDGSAGSILFVKESGSLNTGWVGK